MRLSGKKLLLTGANGGLGRAIAEKALAEGAQLALCERTQELADSALAAQNNIEKGRVKTSKNAKKIPYKLTKIKMEVGRVDGKISPKKPHP